jgi:hypothetical protein
MRASSAAAAAALTGLAALLATGPQAWAQSDSDCQRAFERWSKASASRVVPSSSSGRGACLPTEAVRTDLLEGLSRARGLCAQDSSDQSQQTRTLLNINLSFIASLGVCPTSAPSQSADAGAGWVTKAAPSETQRFSVPIPPAAPAAAPPPRAAVPAPAPPPVPTPPRPVAAAPVPSPAPPAAPPQAAALPAPPCIDISPAQNGSFALVNQRCRGHQVLAVIETAATGGETACRGYTINYTLAVRAPPSQPPKVNYECVVGQGSCNKGRLGDMFPECDW